MYRSFQRAFRRSGDSHSARVVIGILQRARQEEIEAEEARARARLGVVDDNVLDTKMEA
jgi:hypothetical protein